MHIFGRQAGSHTRAWARATRLFACAITLATSAAAGAPASSAQPLKGDEACSAGARTLSEPGARMYPDTGNGGYASLHTDIDMVYDAATDEFLEGNHVVLTDRATRCLSSFTLDFERTSRNKRAGPDMAVGEVTVDGQPASVAFVQPTYPGDPNGPEDPDPRAHDASQNDPVGGSASNPLPPACSPELPSESAAADSHDGEPCPANKLLITPSAVIPDGSTFTVAVYYTGRPGVHNDGDGGEEGWFHSGDGSLVSTEPVGSEDWMPLNDYPTAKPTYGFQETVEAGKVAIANGVLIAETEHAPDAEFPDGSVTWDWESVEPVASYLVQSSVGSYELTEHTASNGVSYYEAQAESIRRARKARNLAIMNQQREITEYESRFNGEYPFTSDGSVVGTPTVDSGEEEMQGMISFNEGTVRLPVLWHENMHQWWGDNVTEGGYAMTFYKEGLAEWMERYVFPARKLGGDAFNANLISRFDNSYTAKGRFWTVAPSNPSPYTLFDNAPTYARPAAAYEALRQILGEPAFSAALEQIQGEYGGGSITEPELEADFADRLPVNASGCVARLAQFFREWFDTAYKPGGGTERPTITGPGLEGQEFYVAADGCAPTGS